MELVPFSLLLAPLAGALTLAWPGKFSEAIVRRISLAALLTAAFAGVLLGVQFIQRGALPQEVLVAKVSISGHLFSILAWIDGPGLALLSVTFVLGLLVVKFSHGYLHREKGFQRFFAIILFFIFGMQLLALAGHLDLFFAGWEIVGMSSFLLISFYRSYSRSVSNATRVYLLYRFCDMGLLIGAVLGHIFWHEASRFSALHTLSVASLSSAQKLHLTILVLLLIFASMGKSAQFPFHNWPARAMEGPTPSSAIFYGALSIHAGVFLLLRTSPLWQQIPVAPVLVGSVGLLTLVFSVLQGGVQTNIKGQISYASTAQIGLMYLELALGLSQLVMVHLVCHALYRCFQLLVSPSIVANSQGLSNKLIVQRLRQRRSWAEALPLSWQRTLYTLAMTDFSMDLSWRGFRFLGWRGIHRRLLGVLQNRGVVWGAFLLPFACAFGPIPISPASLALVLGGCGVFFALKAALQTRAPLRMIGFHTLALVLCAVAVFVHRIPGSPSPEAYFLPLSPFVVLAFVIAYRFRRFDLSAYQAQGTEFRGSARVFLLCFFVLSGMPVTPAFVGEDMLLEDLLQLSVPLTVLVSTVLMLAGPVYVIVYTRLFMGRKSLLG